MVTVKSSHHSSICQKQSPMSVRLIIELNIGLKKSEKEINLILYIFHFSLYK